MKYSKETSKIIQDAGLDASNVGSSDIDSMEGATMSGHLAAAAILDQPVRLATNAAVA